MNTSALLALKQIRERLDLEMCADLLAFDLGLLSETEALERGSLRQFERRYREWQAVGIIPQIQPMEAIEVQSPKN